MEQMRHLAMDNPVRSLINSELYKFNHLLEVTTFSVGLMLCVYRSLRRLVLAVVKAMGLR